MRGFNHCEAGARLHWEYEVWTMYKPRFRSLYRGAEGRGRFASQVNPRRGCLLFQAQPKAMKRLGLARETRKKIHRLRFPA